MYRVVIATGPAKGWSYVTGIAPGERIAVTPMDEPWKWVRVPLGNPEPWPEERTYRQRPAPSAMDGDDIVLEYDVE